MDQFIVLGFYLLALVAFNPDPLGALFGLVLVKMTLSWIRSRRY